MTAFIENIRKFMGWCPNAGAIEARKSIQFDNVIVNAPDSSGELTHTTARWWNKYRNRTLIGCIGTTLLAVNWFISYRINNTDIFLAGLFIGALGDVLTWTQGLQSLDKIAGSETPIKTSTKKMIAIYLLIILGIVTVGYFASVYGLRTTLAFIFGFAFASWGGYLQIVYWEKKNRKTIVAHGFYKPTIAAINSGE
jgi:hypothetical protein